MRPIIADASLADLTLPSGKFYVGDVSNHPAATTVTPQFSGNSMSDHNHEFSGNAMTAHGHSGNNLFPLVATMSLVIHDDATPEGNELRLNYMENGEFFFECNNVLAGDCFISLTGDSTDKILVKHNATPSGPQVYLNGTDFILVCDNTLAGEDVYIRTLKGRTIKILNGSTGGLIALTFDNIALQVEGDNGGSDKNVDFNGGLWRWLPADFSVQVGEASAGTPTGTVSNTSAGTPSGSVALNLS